MTPPDCNRRGPELRPGFYGCPSNRLIHPQPGIVAASTCAICIYADMPDRPERPAATPPAPLALAPRGLGDTIAALTAALGIAPCGGCKERQAALNKLVPYRESHGQPSAGVSAGEGAAP